MAGSLAELEAELGPWRESGKRASEWMYPVESEYLFEYAKQMKPGQVVVEIGVFGGADLALFALEACSGVELIGIDDWSNTTPTARRNLQGEWVEGVDVRTHCLWNLELCGVRDQVTLIEQSSHVVGKSWSTPIDILIIDGDHSFRGAYEDLVDFSSWVNPGGVLVMDDVGSNSDVERALGEWVKGEQEGKWNWVQRWEMPTGKAAILQRNER